VFKGWNHVHARHLTDPEVEGIAASVLIAGDDPKGKATVISLARDMGFHPVDAGPPRVARAGTRPTGGFRTVVLRLRWA
jgi:8-hydroxy-5-deazaflavin:NADPH oxidoreductase